MSGLGICILVWQEVQESWCQSYIARMEPTYAHESLWGLARHGATHWAVCCISSHALSVGMALVVVILCSMGSRVVKRRLGTRHGMILPESKRVLASQGSVFVESLERMTSWGSASVGSSQSMVC